MEERTYTIAEGLISRDGDVLLVCQQGPDDPQPNWGLPGGVVEPGELLIEALVREVREETGLTVKQVGRLVMFSQTLNIDNNTQCLAFTFEVLHCDGTLNPSDPDGFILDARFVPPGEAVRLLRDVPWANMRDPAVAVVGGKQVAGSFWLFREIDGEQQLVGAYPESIQG